MSRVRARCSRPVVGPVSESTLIRPPAAAACSAPALVRPTPPPVAGGKRTAKRRAHSPPPESQAKRRPSPPREDPLQLLLLEMRAISNRVRMLEAGRQLADTVVSPAVDRLPPEEEVDVLSADDLSVTEEVADLDPPSPLGGSLAGLPSSTRGCWREDPCDVELELHPDESSDESLFSPAEGSARGGAADEGESVERDVGVLTEIRQAAYEIGLAAQPATDQDQPKQGIWAGLPLPKGDPPFPVADGYAAMLRRSWATVLPTERWNPGCVGLRRLRYDPEAGLESMPSVEREVAEFTATPLARLEGDPSLPDKEDRAADRLIIRAFDAAMRAVRTGNLLAIALASARHQADGAIPQVSKALTTALTLQSQVVRDLGECLACNVRSRRHLWLRGSSLPLAVREQLVALPVEPRRVFHSTSRAVLEGIGEARKARRKIVEGLKVARPKAPPRRAASYKPQASSSSAPTLPPPPPRSQGGSNKRPFRGHKAGRGRGASSRGGRAGT